MEGSVLARLFQFKQVLDTVGTEIFGCPYWFFRFDLLVFGKDVKSLAHYRCQSQKAPSHWIEEANVSNLFPNLVTHYRQPGASLLDDARQVLASGMRRAQGSTLSK